MRIKLFYFLLMISSILSINTVLAQVGYIQVRGSLHNKSDKLSVRETMLVLTNANGQSYTAYSNETGRFTFDSVSNTGSITLQVRADGFDDFSKSFTVKNNVTSYDVGVIYLSPKILTVSAATYVSENLLKNEILPTESAKELFYTLNPELRDRDSVTNDYSIRLPDFPKRDKEIEKQENDNFKRNKRKTNPDAANINPANKAHHTTVYKGSACNYTGYTITDSLVRFFGDHPEKFVFVIYKRDAAGNPILKGPEVEGRFIVYYYGSYKEGDTSVYHKADKATYGYATMWNASYKILVLDKYQNKFVNTRETVIETSDAFEKHDLFRELNMHVVWIKIPIEIFE